MTTRFPVRLLATQLIVAGLLTSCARIPQGTHPPGAELQERLERIIEDNRFRGVQVGISVRSVNPPLVLVGIHEDQMMTPASTVKLFTSGTSLALLGPSYSFGTRLVYSGDLDEHGVLDGDLLIIGGGDPTFPRTSSGGLGLDLYEIWADILRTMGLRRVDGRVVVVDDFFEDHPLGYGWCWDDQGYPFSAEVSGLNFADNCVNVYVQPGREAGDPARTWLWPPGTRFVTIDNRVVTGEAGGPDSVVIHRSVCGNVILCEGTVSVNGYPVSERVAITEPGRYAATVLEEVLERTGIEIRGKPERSRPGFALLDTTWVTEHISPPLWEVIRRVNKDSDNLCAESLLRTIGRELGKSGDAVSGLAAVREYAFSCGVDSGGLVLVDGSGLSRLNAVSAKAVTAFLACFASHDLFGDFYQSLAIAGVDGTLKSRFVGTPGEGSLRGKSGSMAGVSALSGYLVDRRGEQIVFCVLLNGYRADGGSLMDLVDLLAREIAEFSPA
ncbi:MAG: D-alanyl-D-alanine carboxypeptidase/D-alanyl-D-alanine-endopeptidase [Candidatus Eisenbacteria sp.]|nr:D-alanyl-D-alanine carboxypeptidase/D-alanyl-D-alanine-endopeptidase [Candidatus Eisenbacteria bacterium]